MVISDTWSRKNATKNIPPFVTDQSSDQFPSQQQRKNVDKRKKAKRAWETGAQWISEDQCADGKFLFGVKQTTTYESWQYF